MSTLDELRRMLVCGDRLPGRPRCEHVSFDRRVCDRQAEVACDTGDPGRPKYVCGVCSWYQVAILGPIELVGDEGEPVRINAEGGIVRDGRRTRR